MYAQNGELDDTRGVFDKNTFRNDMWFTALISGYPSRDYMDATYLLFDVISELSVLLECPNIGTDIYCRLCGGF